MGKKKHKRNIKEEKVMQQVPQTPQKKIKVVAYMDSVNDGGFIQ